MVDPAPARVHPTALIEDGAVIGSGTAVWDGVHIRAGAAVGRDCIVGEKTYIAGGVVVGDRCKINAHVYLCAGVSVGVGVLIAAHVVFTNDRTPRATDVELRQLRPSEPDQHTERCRVGDGASIGANATIGPGVSLGDYCMVGMGAVVTADAPPHALLVGNPARLVGLVARDGRCVLRLGPGEQLPVRARVACPGDGYLRVEDGTVAHESG